MPSPFGGITGYDGSDWPPVTAKVGNYNKLRGLDNASYQIGQAAKSSGADFLCAAPCLLAQQPWRALWIQ